jgi:NTE family protein
MSEMMGLVIGGGGFVGIAWEIGVFKALEDGGASLKKVSAVIGTSAGALVGAQYFSGRDIDVMFREQHHPGWLVHVSKLVQSKKAKPFTDKQNDEESKREQKVRLGRSAIESRSFLPQSLYIKMVQKVIKVKGWPQDVNYMPTTTDCETGDLKLWRQSDSIPFIRAVAASCCVPNILPPVTINGRRYVDGGCGSVNNFDKIIETGIQKAIFIGPFGGEHSPEIGQERRKLSKEIEQVKQAGIDALVITPSAKLAESCGLDILNPALSPAAAECGLADGRDIAGKVKAFLE